MKKPNSVRVHDHFDGSAHCIECGGPCQLEGAEAALTSIIRYVFESLNYGNGISYTIQSELVALGVDMDKFRQRAWRYTAQATIPRGAA